MIKLGVNTVLFSGSDLATAVRHIARAGYDGVELSALKGMCEHLVLDRWEEQAEEIKAILADNGTAALSMEEAALDRDRLKKAFAAGQAIGVPVVNIGPGGESGNEDDFKRQTDLMIEMAEVAEGYGVTLCTKAHVGQCVFDTPTTLRAMKKVKSVAFGIDMDPSHIHRAGEDPAEALSKVLKRVRHVHVRDCKGSGPGPGEPKDQTCGRGDIDLATYFKVMVDGGYDGPVCLEVIGAGNYELSYQAIVAAESYGYMNACLKALGVR
jgi:sugar phosphate isomerase/epimerase